MIVPKIRYGAEVYHSLKKVLHDQKLGTGGGDEGGFAPGLKSNEHALEVIALAVKQAGYTFGKDIFVALDPASSEFFRQGIEDLHLQEIGRQQENRRADDRAFTRISPGASPSFPSRTASPKTTGTAGRNSRTPWARPRSSSATTSSSRTSSSCKKGIDAGVGNSILVKVNQIGSLTETFDAVELAKRNGYTSVLSHRSGESEDTTIADIAVALNVGQIKTGSFSQHRSSREVQTSSSASRRNSAATPSSEAPSSRTMAGARFLDPSSIPLKRQSGGNIWATLVPVIQGAIALGLLVMLGLFFVPRAPDAGKLQGRERQGPSARSPRGAQTARRSSSSRPST